MQPEVEWSYEIHDEPDGTCRVDILDEDGERVPVARKVTRGQAARIVQAIGEESFATGKPASAVVRDPYFMASTVITVKRQDI